MSFFRKSNMGGGGGGETDWVGKKLTSQIFPQGKKLTGQFFPWGKNSRPILSTGKKLTVSLDPQSLSKRSQVRISLLAHCCVTQCSRLFNLIANNWFNPGKYPDKGNLTIGPVKQILSMKLRLYSYPSV